MCVRQGSISLSRMPGLPQWSRTKRTSDSATTKLDRAGELTVIYADAEAQIEVREQAHALDEVGSQTGRVIRFVLDQASDAADALVRRELFQVGRDRSAALERLAWATRAPCRGRRARALDARRLLEILPGIDGDLDPHQRLDLALAALIIEMRHQAQQSSTGLPRSAIGNPRPGRRGARARRRSGNRAWRSPHCRAAASTPSLAAAARMLAIVASFSGMPSVRCRRSSRFHLAGNVDHAWPRAPGACPGIPG